MIAPNKYILICLMPSGSLWIANGKDTSHIVAEEGNQYLLNEMGDRLIDEGIIKGYQIAKMVGAPVLATVPA